MAYMALYHLCVSWLLVNPGMLETLVISGVSVIFGIPEPELQCFDSGNPNGAPWLNLAKNCHFLPCTLW